MLFNSRREQVVFSIIIISLTAISGCGDGQAIGQMIAADPQLKKNTVSQNVKETKIQAQKDIVVADGQDTEKIDTKVKDISPDSPQDLPTEFPSSLPLYPQAKLSQVKSGLTPQQGTTLWHAEASNEQVAIYYQQEFKANNWKIIQPFNFNDRQGVQTAIATKDDLQVTVNIAEPADANNNNKNNPATQLILAYQPVTQATTVTDSEQPPNKQDIASQQPITAKTANPKTQSQKQNTVTEKPITSSSTTTFIDLDEVPEQIRKYVRQVAALEVLTPYTQEGNIDLTKFAPNQPVTRGEYARWLIAANNKYYDDTPGKKIYLADQNAKSAFKDVKANHADFSAIQGLAEAGLIPSMLTDDSTKLLFQPDAPLNREDLIAWKVPLDIRKALPTASIEAIEESWGFQDTASIDPAVLRALFADFQNGDRSNLQRVFGYTTLFQPKKPVTRAEAAASLWYFGFQGDGITAPEVLKSQE